MPAGIRARAGWTGWRIAGAAALLVMGGLVTWQMWAALGRLTLMGSGLIYLPLLPIVLAWIIWVRRRRVRLCSPKGHLAAPLVVVVGWLIYRWGIDVGAGGDGARLVSGDLALHLGGWMVMAGCVLAICREALRQFGAAFGALAFAVAAPLVVHEAWIAPVHGRLIEISWSLCHMLEVSGGGTTGLTAHKISTAVSQVGNLVALFLALCMVLYAFAFSRPWRWSVRAVILGLAPVAAVLCGTVALVVMAWVLGRLTPPTQVLVPISGGGMLAVGLTVLAVLIRVLAWASVPLRLYPRASLEQ